MYCIFKHIDWLLKIFQSESSILVHRKIILKWSLQDRPQAVWPDLAKFRHFGKSFKVFCNFKKLYLLLGNILNLLWQIFTLLCNFHCHTGPMLYNPTFQPCPWCQLAMSRQSNGHLWSCRFPAWELLSRSSHLLRIPRKAVFKIKEN